MLRSLTLSLVGDESLDIGIEWMYLDSAAGDAAPLVRLVAVDSLKADEGDSWSDPFYTLGTPGHLCLCNSRECWILFMVHS